MDVSESGWAEAWAPLLPHRRGERVDVPRVAGMKAWAPPLPTQAGREGGCSGSGCAEVGHLPHLASREG